VVARHRQLVAVVAVPDGNSMSPPQLAANAPVADVFHPVEVHPNPTLRVQPQAATADRLDCWHGQWRHAYEPLLRQIGLDDRVAALAAPNWDAVGFGLDQQTPRLEVGDYLLACREALESGVGSAVLVDMAVWRHDHQSWETMPLPHLEI